MGAGTLTSSARAEAVTVLANMTMTALEGGGDERRGKDHQQPPCPARGDLSAAVIDGPGARAYRVHDPAVRPGRGGGPAGLGPHRRSGDRHRPGRVGPVGCGPRGLHRAGGEGLFWRGWGDLRGRDLTAGPLECRG